MSGKTPIIVVIDDNQSSLSMYRLAMESLQVDLHAFSVPTESIDYLADSDADLIFLDILMEDMDGLQILRKLRETKRHRETAVVMVTTKDYAQDRATATKLDAKEFLVKPMRSQEIRDVVCKYTTAESKDGAATGG